MYRFLLRPKWIAFHLLCIAAVIGMVMLAFWQLRRLDERRTFNARVRTAAAQPVADFATVVTPNADPAQIEYRQVRVTGTYLAHQFEVVNVSQDGTGGSDPVGALQLDDGTILLVNRGFIDGGGTMPAPPAGKVTIVGRVRQSGTVGLGQVRDDASKTLTQIRRVELDVLAGQFDAPLQPIYVEQLTSQPADDPSLRQIPFPSLSEGPHLSYTVQWFVFSTCVVVGWVLSVRKSAGERRGDPKPGRHALIPEQYL